MGFGDWSIRNWKALAGLTTAVVVAAGALVGYASNFTGPFPALGGPNGLLYDITLEAAQPWRRHIPSTPVVLVAIDNASLASPEFAGVPRLLFQPIWARLIDGLLDAGARRIAFNVVVAYAGADFKVGQLTLPGYDQTLVDTLARGRDRVVIARFPTTPPAAAFHAAAGAARVGVLDLQLESDGRVRSTAPLSRLPDGRVALGFAALGTGWSVRQAASAERILITPSAPVTDVPTYSLVTLLACLSSETGAEEVRKAVEGRIVVVGTTVPGEDDHRGPGRFLGRPTVTPPSDRCAPQQGLFERPQSELLPGALLQIAAIQSATSERRVTLAPAWLRLGTGAALALIFAMMAFRDEAPLALGQSRVSRGSVLSSPPTTSKAPLLVSLALMEVRVHVARSVALGLVGPVLVGCAFTAAAFVWADLWLPMGYPILVTILAFGILLGIRTVRHRALFRRLFQTTGEYIAATRSSPVKNF